MSVPVTGTIVPYSGGAYPVVNPPNIGTTGYTITQSIKPVLVVADASTITFDLSQNDWQTTTLGGSRTLAISNPTLGQGFTLVIQQAASGGPYSPTWFSTINWMAASGFTAPSMPTTASAYLTVTFKYWSSGVYFGWWMGNSAT